MGKWEMVWLGDVCDVLNGFAFQSTNYISNGHRVIRITNVQKGAIVDDDPKYYNQSPALDNYELYDNDLLMSLTGNVGRVGLISENMLPAYLNQRVACLREKTRLLSKKFLYFYLNADDFERDAINSSKGLAQKNMSTEWLKNYAIPLPPLPVQRKIADVLDRASALIEKRKEQIYKLDLLMKSQFIEMFGDIPKLKWVTISSICSIITDGTHQPPKFSPSGIPFLFVSNIASNRITYNTEKYISEETYAELISRTPIELGDILLSTVGSYGHPAVVRTTQRFCFQRHIAYLKPKQDLVNSDYFYGAILSPSVQAQIEERVKGVAQKTLNLSDIREIRIPLPNIDEQRRFSKLANTVDAQKILFQQSLGKLEQNYNSLIQKCFRGEIF